MKVKTLILFLIIATLLNSVAIVFTALTMGNFSDTLEAAVRVFVLQESVRPTSLPPFYFKFDPEQTYQYQEI